jgi:nucleoside-diphosphate kinase
MEHTMILVKPDGVERGLAGQIISRFENKGLTIRAMKMMQVNEDLCAKHYAEHVDKPFYPDLKKFIMRGPIVAMVIAGEDAVLVCRKMMGATKFSEAEPGTIRGDYAFSFTENLVHGSDSVDSAAREISLYFSDNELVG